MGILERLIELEAKDRLAETQHRVNERRKYWIILTQNDKSAVHALKKQQFLMEKEAELLNYGMNRGYAYDNGQLEDSDSLAPGSIFGRGSLSPDQTGGLSQVQADEATSDAARVVTTFRLMTQKALNIVTENNEKHDVSLSSSKNSATASRGLFSEFNTSNLLHNYNIADIYAWGENADEVGPTSGGTSVASLVQRHTRSSIPESGSSRERRFQSTALLEASTAVSKLQDMSLRAELSLQRQASHGNALETEMWTLQSRIRHVRY